MAVGAFAAAAIGQNNDIQSAVVAGGGGGFSLKKPEMYHTGWVDLNKNGKKDVYEDPAQPVEKRIDDLLKQMSREEKIGQLMQQPMKEGTDKKDAALLAAGGMGSYLGASPDPSLRNRLQRLAVEESRLGIPLIFGFDTIHGLTTVFPIPLGMAASWDPGLVERLNTMAAAESTAAGIDWVFAPMLDIARDPRWGRIAEGAGEDPWLGSKIAAAAVRGFQGKNYGEADRVAACLKHYVGYGAAEGGRDYNTTEIGMFTFRNIYLPPFKAGVDAGAATLMSAFNALNSVPASGNKFTLDQVLRKEWKFDGFVVSDWNAVAELMHHGYAADEAECTQISLPAGVDMEMVSECYRHTLPALLDSGKVSKDVFDEAVRRILRVKFRKGLFDHPYTGPAKLDQAAHNALAREAVAHCCVLLKNDKETLPMQSPATVALVGPLGDDQANLLGCWSGLGRPQDVVTVKQGLTEALGGAKLLVAKGCDLTGKDESGIEAAVEAAKQADVVVMALGEPALWSGENNNRWDLGLPGVQQKLFDRVAAAGKPVVAVLFAGRPLAVPTVLEKASAVVMAWHPGVQGGPGIADVLTGKVAPTGRITATFPKYVGQVPIHYNHLATGRPIVDYKDKEGSKNPLLPFGYGLTYTKFKYSPTKLSGSTVKDEVTVTATVTNTGKREGTEVAQLYIHDVACNLGARPVRELKGYERVTLKPGESKEVSFTLKRQDLGCYDVDGNWVTQPGKFEAVVAPNSAAGKMVGFTLE
jgi:beta-glucosidase